mmetsp:Transcript_53318/g.111296  ORF Transcript_53318/g.111296 Transcript_53318/m.111296 type:complete len:299 (-) Transcript_53318:755-1651(-)
MHGYRQPGDGMVRCGGRQLRRSGQEGARVDPMGRVRGQGAARRDRQGARSRHPAHAHARRPNQGRVHVQAALPDLGCGDQLPGCDDADVQPVRAGRGVVPGAREGLRPAREQGPGKARLDPLGPVRGGGSGVPDAGEAQGADQAGLRVQAALQDDGARGQGAHGVPLPHGPLLPQPSLVRRRRGAQRGGLRDEVGRRGGGLRAGPLRLGPLGLPRRGSRPPPPGPRPRRRAQGRDAQRLHVQNALLHHPARRGREDALLDVQQVRHDACGCDAVLVVPRRGRLLRTGGAAGAVGPVHR